MYTGVHGFTDIGHNEYICYVTTLIASRHLDADIDRQLQATLATSSGTAAAVRRECGLLQPLPCSEVGPGTLPQGIAHSDCPGWRRHAWVPGTVPFVLRRCFARYEERRGEVVVKNDCALQGVVE